MRDHSSSSRFNVWDKKKKKKKKKKKDVWGWLLDNIRIDNIARDISEV